MLATDVGFVVYFSVTGLGLIPPEWAFAGYADPVMVAWNWSFLWIDLAASATGLTSLWLLRRAAATGSPEGGPSAVGSGAAHGTPLMLVSLVLTMASGLMAVAFWTLRGDFSLMWWIPNLYLLLFPLPAVVALVAGPRARPATGG
ncbi:DUF5360 family protein, partial [Nonomuraea sp. RK-328]|nr:DUF5360 family protein [Nonomuraea sp. RK-328]